MSTLNKVILIGRLGDDPEIRYTQTKKKIANLRLATSDSWKDRKTGEKREKTEWHKVVVFNEGLAGVIEKHIKKGHLIYIEGTLQTRKWDDKKQGVTRYTTEIVLSDYNAEFKILSNAESRSNAPQDPVVSSNAPKPQAEPPSAPGGELDDEIPF